MSAACDGAGIATNEPTIIDVAARYDTRRVAGGFVNVIGKKNRGRVCFLKTVISSSKRRAGAVILAGLAAIIILAGVAAASGQGAHLLLAFRHIDAYWLPPAIA